jgi:uncharacterized membrane protein
MQVLPEGLVLPPVPYVAGLAGAAVLVVVALYRLRPPVTDRVVVAAIPWMVLGGGVHAVEQQGLAPDPLVPLLAAPAVYMTTTTLAGAVWAVAAALGPENSDPGGPTRVLGWVGGAALLGFVVAAYAYAFSHGQRVALAWPVVGGLGAVAIGAPVYKLLSAQRQAAVERAGHGGPVIVFAHAVDGISTALGVDVLGTGERSPIPRTIMEYTGRLPLPEALGTAWLFVFVKLGLAALLVVLLAEYVETDPVEGNLLVLFVAAVGLGPAANNLALFLLAGA